MTHSKKTIHHFKSNNRKYLTGLLALSFLIVLSVGIFSTTKVRNPSVSELAFTEYSTLGVGAGSVIPASCESSPVAYHTADYNNTVLISDFECYMNGESPMYVGSINQVNGQTAYAQCQQMTGNFGLIMAIPGTASCPAPTVNLFFSSNN